MGNGIPNMGIEDTKVDFKLVHTIGHANNNDDDTNGGSSGLITCEQMNTEGGMKTLRENTKGEHKGKTQEGDTNG